MASRLNLRLFGGFRLEDEAGRSISIPLRKGEALLAFLAIANGQVASREALAALLWGESDQTRARQSLRQALFALTREFAQHEATVLRLESQLVSLYPASLWVDACEFETCLTDGTPGDLARAAALYRGDFLADLSIDAPDFEDWLSATRNRYQDMAQKAFVSLLEEREARGDREGAIAAAQGALRLDPYREDLHRRLMRLFVAQGMRSTALTQYRACRDILARDLSVAPDEETQALYHEILGKAPSGQLPGSGPAKAGPGSAGLADGPPGVAEAEPVAAPSPAAARGADGVPTDLGAAALAVLRAASVIGTPVNYAVLAVMAEMDEDALATALEELAAYGVLSPRGDGTFNLDRTTAQRVYEGLMPPRRIALHLAAAEAIAANESYAPENRLAELARHYGAAGRLEERLNCEVQAGLSEENQGRRAAARKWFERGAKTAKSLGLGLATRAATFDTLLGLARLAEADGEPAETLAILRQAEEQLVSCDDPTYRARVFAQFARAKGLLGEAEAAMSYARRACDELRRGGDTAAVWHGAEVLLTRVHVLNASRREAVDRIVQSVGVAKRKGYRIETAEILSILAFVRGLRGEFEGAREAAREAIAVAETLADEGALVPCLEVGALVDGWRGAGDAAVAAIERARGIVKARGDAFRSYVVAGIGGYVAASNRDTASAESGLDEAIACAKRLGTRFLLPLFSAWRAEAANDAGDSERALQLARVAFDLAAETNQAWPRSIALRALARALADPAMRDFVGAEKAIRSAAAEQEGLGLLVELARSKVVHAKTLRAAGNLQRSSEVYAEASELFQRMRMTGEFDSTKTMADALRPTS